MRLVRDKETNFGKGFGYVMFKVHLSLLSLLLKSRNNFFMKDRTSLPDALRLNDVPFNGRKLRVSRAKKHTPTPGAGPKNPQQQSKDKTTVFTVCRLPTIMSSLMCTLSRQHPNRRASKGYMHRRVSSRTFQPNRSETRKRNPKRRKEGRNKRAAKN